MVLTYPKISATIERQMVIKKELDGLQYSEKEKILDKLVKNFAYAKADFTGYISYAKEDVLKEYEHADSFNINIDDDITKREKMFKSFDLTSTERKIFNIFAFCTFSRDERRAYQQKLFSLIDWSLRSLSMAYDIPLKFLKYATIDELSDQNLSSKKYKELLQERFDRGFMIYWKTRGIGGYLLGDQAKEKFDSLSGVSNVNENDKEIKGQVAYRGNTKGFVQVILDSKIPVPEEPFVLVTGMTSPDYIQHIQKCIAIITNEGGITCHAAILSRELKKPCIIGTKIATQVLKDGDLVEVDAERGIVTILKKANADRK